MFSCSNTPGCVLTWRLASPLATKPWRSSMPYSNVAVVGGVFQQEVVLHRVVRELLNTRCDGGNF